MRVLVVLSFIVPFLSCTTINHNVVTVEQYKLSYIDSQFNPIIDSFIYEARSRGHTVNLTNLSMTFGNIRIKKDDRTVGYCVHDVLGGMIIKIHDQTWKDMDIYSREQLVFHEMGHCLIGREHCIKANKDGPISIMFPRVLDSNYYRIHREELVDELFNISPECIGDDGNVNEVDGKVCTPPIR